MRHPYPIIATMAFAACIALAGCQGGNADPSDSQTPSGTDVNPPAVQAPPAQQKPEAPAAPQQSEPVYVTIYAPNSNADGFDISNTTVSEKSGEALVTELVKAGALRSGVGVNSCTLEGKTVKIDMNAAFEDQIRTSGTTGEYYAVGCLVNTLLDAYQADAVVITVDGHTPASGHCIYDQPLSRYAR